MKDLSKGFTGITNFNPFFLCYGSKERFKNPPFFLPPRLFYKFKKKYLWVRTTAFMPVYKILIQRFLIITYLNTKLGVIA